MQSMEMTTVVTIASLAVVATPLMVELEMDIGSCGVGGNDSILIKWAMTQSMEEMGSIRFTEKMATTPSMEEIARLIYGVSAMTQ